MLPALLSFFRILR